MEMERNEMIITNVLYIIDTRFDIVSSHAIFNYHRLVTVTGYHMSCHTESRIRFPDREKHLYSLHLFLP